MNKYLAIYGKPKYLGIVGCKETLTNAAQIIVESTRGEDVAMIIGVLSEEQEIEYRALRNTVERGDNAAKTTEPAVTDLKFIKIADEKEYNEMRVSRAEEIDILRKAKEIVLPHNLDIKIIDVELLPKKQKLFVYFSSDQRVDFRAYVRDLAKEFRTRIELRQIGVRDEAKIVGGLGMCGHQCCCSYWLHQFVPVGIKMVKEQNLALNPTKISGICGRLMCCMCYEHNVYSELWEGLPAPGSKLKAAEGNITISGIDVGTRAIKCYIPGLGEKSVAIDKFEEFRIAVEDGKTTAELESLINDEERYGLDALDMDIFKDSIQSGNLNKENKNSCCKGYGSRYINKMSEQKAEESAKDENGSILLEKNEENQAETADNVKKKHFKYHRRGGKKHHSKTITKGGEH